MLSRSHRSFRSIRSLGSSSVIEDGVSGILSRHDGDGPHSNVFEEMLPYICAKFGCEFNLLVTKYFIRGKKASGVQFCSEEGAKSGDGYGQFEHAGEMHTSYKRVCIISPTGLTKPKADAGFKQTDNIISVRAFYDNSNTLVEIFFQNELHGIPRMILQAIILIAPHYENASKITMRRCKVDAYNLYQLNKLVSLMNLTDVCLDDTLFFSAANYAILLENKSSLRQLSLCRCSITDVVCQQIVSYLQYPAQAEKSLLILHLSGNLITDEGAIYIGDMLRTNRSLRYLNLAGNDIGDVGAQSILVPLKEFKLTYDEIAEKRRYILSYFKRKHELTRKFMYECSVNTPSESTSSISLNTQPKPKPMSKKNAPLHVDIKNRKSKKCFNEKKAEMVAIRFIGNLLEQHPFGASNAVIKDGWSYSTGNLTLSHLNLSYNNLSYLSVKKVLDVLIYQSRYNTAGLLKVILDGNNIPEVCKEYEEISAFLNKKLTVHIGNETSKVKNRISKHKVSLSMNKK